MLFSRLFPVLPRNIPLPLLSPGNSFSRKIQTAWYMAGLLSPGSVLKLPLPRNDHFSGNVLSPLFFRFLLPGRLHLQKQWSFLFHPHSRYGPGHLFFYQIPSPYFLPCFPFFSKSPFLPRSPVSTTNRDTVCRL